ncbi:MAG: hypothetical protein M2R45_02793 [Verrucomicrobia subdivision 3 bacterium]|nr:hypothetical protein [Limisphaerales bacterium]MCS1414345.1 hypothetical protein [Limisphaerales bacterium]
MLIPGRVFILDPEIAVKEALAQALETASEARRLDFVVILDSHAKDHSIVLKDTRQIIGQQLMLLRPD